MTTPSAGTGERGCFATFDNLDSAHIHIFCVLLLFFAYLASVAAAATREGPRSSSAPSY